MSSLLPHNQRLIDFVQTVQPIGFAALFAAFDGAGESEKAFSRQLHYLKTQGWLRNEGRAHRARWSVNPHQVTHLAPAQAAKPANLYPIANSPPAATSLVPPRQVSWLHGPVYRPSPAGPIRHGALDFMQLASHGNRC